MKSSRVLLFTGHRVDGPDRGTPRLPAERVPGARRMISDAVQAEMAAADGHGASSSIAMAGGASGGDLLFMEICIELGMQSQLWLALPRPDYLRESVIVPGQPHWLERFEQVEKVSQVFYMKGSGNTDPDPLKKAADAPARGLPVSENVWQMNNHWMLSGAITNAARTITLIALWDGHRGDGPGGTEEMVLLARKNGIRVVELNTGDL